MLLRAGGRADPLGQVTVLTKHGRPAAVIAPAPTGELQASLAEVWALLDRVCPPGVDPGVDQARARRDRPQAAAGRAKRRNASSR